MNITRPLWGNLYGTKCSEQVEAKLLTGHSFEESLRNGHIGNDFYMANGSIGEESGELVKMLNHCGHYYESILFKIYCSLRAIIRTYIINRHGHWCSRISRFCYVSLIYVYRQTRRTIDIILLVLNSIKLY